MHKMRRVMSTLDNKYQLIDYVEFYEAYLQRIYDKVIFKEKKNSQESTPTKKGSRIKKQKKLVLVESEPSISEPKGQTKQ